MSYHANSPSPRVTPPIVLGLGVSILLLGVLAVWMTQTVDADPPQPAVASAAPVSTPLSDDLFRHWPDKKPDLLLVLSGQQHGYLQPCGCSRPQLGGLERRFMFLKHLRDKGWPVVPIDLGELAYHKPGGVHEQSLLKFDVSMAALEKMGYQAIGVGRTEFEMPLIEVTARFPLQNPTSPLWMLAANLKDRETQFPLPGDRQTTIGDWKVIASSKEAPRVGVVSVVGLSVTNEIVKKDKTVQFLSNAKVLTDTLTTMSKSATPPDLKVLLYHGTEKEAIAAASIGQGQPKFDVVVYTTVEEEPSSNPLCLDATGKVAAPKPSAASALVVGVGHKGRYVGLVGVFRTGKANKPFEFHYQLAKIGEEYETPPDQDAVNPILKMLEDYTKQLKDQDFLAKYPQAPLPMSTQKPGTPLQYVGSDRCATCHDEETKIWKKTGHSHAFEALVQAKRPALRQFDGECVVCHTVGFGYQSGYTDEKRTPHLKHVGCENCHGPGSAHVDNPNHPALKLAMNPWRTSAKDRLLTASDLQKIKDPNERKQAEARSKALLLRVDKMCQKCHDTDNDPKFRFEEYWPKITHYRAR